MGGPSDTMTELARSLVLLEEEIVSAATEGPNAENRVIEKLRLLVTGFSGTDSYIALLRRSLVLTRSVHSSLHGPKLNTDGSIVSSEEMPVDAGLTLVAHLLGLMTTFIGEGSTMDLLAHIWPVEAQQKG